MSSSDCILCDPGKYQTNSAHTFCQLCDRGKYSDLAGFSICSLCKAGTFQNVSGETSCPSCSRNSQNPTQLNSSSALDLLSCECSPLYYAIPVDKLLVFQSIDSISYNVYIEEYVAFDPVPDFDPNMYLGFWCAKCPEGADCNSPGTTLTNVQAAQGFFPGFLCLGLTQIFIFTVN